MNSINFAVAMKWHGRLEEITKCKLLMNLLAKVITAMPLDLLMFIQGSNSYKQMLVNTHTRASAPSNRDKCLEHNITSQNNHTDNTLPNIVVT